MGWERFDHSELHKRLCDRALTRAFRERQQGAQALHCPYYVPLKGLLGADWGVIVNPASVRFALLTFEHDDCGCPPSDDEGWGRHRGAPTQDGDTWWTGWTHHCHDYCEQPCRWDTTVQQPATERAYGATLRADGGPGAAPTAPGPANPSHPGADTMGPYNTPAQPPTRG